MTPLQKTQRASRNEERAVGIASSQATTLTTLVRTGLICLAAVIAATLLRMAIAPLVGTAAPFVTYFLTTLVVVWYRGFGAAVFLILLSAAAGIYFFVLPANPVAVLGFLAASSGASFLIDLQRRTLSRVERETARRRDAEIAEREQRMRFETTLASIGDAVVTTDAEGHVVFANRVAQSLLGWPEPDLVGKHLDEVFRIVNELTRAKMENPVSRVLREGVVVGLANHTLLIARDGTEIPIDDSGAPILGENGLVQGTVLVFRDVSARRQAEAATALLASIVKSSDDAIISEDLEGVITSWNRGAERMFGYLADEIFGQPISVIAPADRQDEMPAILERVRRGEGIDNYQTVRRTKSGALIQVSITISPLHDALGRVIGASKILRDITASKRMEQERLDMQVKAQALTAEKALREMEAELARVVRALSIGELATSIAHEVNQPLAGVVTNAEAALRWLSGDEPNLLETRESLALIVRDGRRASAVIRRIREFLKNTREEMASLDMNETIQEAVALAEAELRKRRVTLRIARSLALPAVRGDRIQLQQVILNLILNGSESMADTNGSKELLVTSQPSENGSALVAVRDSGVGVNPEDLQRMFDPFFTTKDVGMGLGLSISRSIIEAHGGKIWAELNEGPGLTVQFCIPPEDHGAGSIAQS
jgi:PAS domain S-box-containing protein